MFWYLIHFTVVFILINMERSKITKSKEKGGAQKTREKRSKELELAGRDPKQMKLSFSVVCKKLKS